MKSKLAKRNLRFSTAAVLMLLAALVMVLPASVQAALPAPNFMPNFPMLAGPQVIIMWTPVPGAVKYNVYMNGEKIGESPAMQLIHPAPTAGGEYKFTVRAVDGSGVESPDSQPGIIKIVLVEPPKEITALPGTDRISLRWETAPGAIIYDIFRRRKGESEFKFIQSVQDTRYQDTTVEVNVPYEYAITSKDNTGKSSGMSTIVEAMVTERTKEEGFEGYSMNPLPSREIENLRTFYEGFPTDIHFANGSAVVSAGGRLFYHAVFPGDFSWKVIFDGLEAEPDSSQAEEIERLKGIQFKGIFLDDDGFVWGTKDEKIYKIDPVAERVVETFQVPKPAKGELVYKDTRGEIRDMVNSVVLTDVSIGSDGRIYASDNGNSRVVMMSQDGDFMGVLGYNKENPEDQSWLVPKAGYNSISPDGRVFVNAIIQLHVFDPEKNVFLYTLGTQGDTVGQFASVNGATWDDEGRIWIVDGKQGTIQAFAENPENPEDRRWEPVRLILDEKMNGNPNVPKPVSLVFGPRSASGNQRAYILSSPTQSLYVFDLLWDKAPEPGTFKRK